MQHHMCALWLWQWKGQWKRIAIALDEAGLDAMQCSAVQACWLLAAAVACWCIFWVSLQCQEKKSLCAILLPCAQMEEKACTNKLVLHCMDRGGSPFLSLVAFGSLLLCLVHDWPIQCLIAVHIVATI